MSGEEPNNKKLRSDENFNKINQFVTLKEEEIKEYNVIFTEVTAKIINILKQDEVFKKYYRRPMYTGSFYKQTRVGKPKEFDLNIILAFPDLNSGNIEKGRPGFAKIRFDKSKLSPVWTEHKVLNKWLDGKNYLDNEKIRRWFEGVVQKSLGCLKDSLNNKIFLQLDTGSKCEVKIKKSGPAFTLCVTHGSKEFSVDLVPVLEFSQPPLHLGFQPSKQLWHLVPKPLKDGENPNQQWRYSFFCDEHEMLKKYGSVKPVIRHIKKLRDTQNWSILPSYYIETLFFHAISDGKIDKSASQTLILVLMLKELSKAFRSGRLYYFWDKSLNLFGELTEEKIFGVQNRLVKIIKEIEADQSSMTQYFLTKEEQEKIKKVDKSPVKQSVNVSCNVNSKAGLNEIKALKSKISPLEDSFKNLKIQRDADKIDAASVDGAEIKQLLLSLIDEVRLLKSNVRTLEIKIDRINNSMGYFNSRSTLYDSEEIMVIH